MILTNGRVFDGRKFLRKNTVEIRRGKIARIFSLQGIPQGAVNLKGKILAPGLIDMHTHAAAHIDFLGLKTSKDIMKVKKAFFMQGVTSFMAATVYSALDKKRPSIISKLLNEKSGARCLGVYLEGPFINSIKKGAIQGKYIMPNDGRQTSNLKRIMKLYPALRIMTVAPELPGAEKVIKYLRKKGIIVSFGHSNAGHGEAKKGVKAGIRHVTHLFNGMRKWDDKNPSYKALLADKRVMVEIIADGRHVPPEILRMVYKKFGKDRIVLISDATGGKGFYDAAREVGTNLELIELVRRMKKFCGLSVEEAMQMVTLNPARLLGARTGVIKKGYPAEMIILSRGLKLIKIVTAGL